jgi:hypothetical protein
VPRYRAIILSEGALARNRLYDQQKVKPYNKVQNAITKHFSDALLRLKQDRNQARRAGPDGCLLGKI